MTLSCYCGGESGEVVTKVLGGGEEGKVIRCNSCGVVRRCDALVEEIREFHEENLQAEQLKQEFDQVRENTTDQQMTDTRRRVDAMRGILNGNESVLDIGTGLGFFLDEISPHADKTIGTEVSRKRRAYVEENTDHILLEDTPSVLKEYGEGYFDMVTLFHVLEHFPDPMKQLEGINRLLSEDGKLIIEVPNHDDWLPKISDEYFDFYYQPAHIYYFTESTLVDLLHKTGFEVNTKHIQRYGLENARHWIEDGEPQVNNPDMVADEEADTMDEAYAKVLRELGLTDTLWAVASK